MATYIQHQPVFLQQHTDDEDVALATFLTNTLKLDQTQNIWNQQPYYNSQQRNHNNRTRSRVSNSPQVQKSVSTPRPRKQQHHLSSLSPSSSTSTNTSSRPSSKPKAPSKSTHIRPVIEDRRPSATSSVGSSVQSDVSTSSKLSLSKRIRRVFSMNNLKTEQTLIEREVNPAQPSKRRSFITNLFNKERRHSSADLNKKPTLKVDTQHIKKVRTPDSPNSVISSRSTVRDLGLPSPTPSEDVSIGFGLKLHGSPRLKPTSSSSTSSLVPVGRKIQFSSTVQVHETFHPQDYDRRCDNNATCQKLTPMLAMKIKQELNSYKLTEMNVHVESRQYTHFFL